MAMRLFVLYAVIEMAVIVALVAAIGFGWTLLVLVAVFLLGIAVAGSQLRRQVAVVARGIRGPGAQITDSALVALGSVLTVIPGLVTTVAGLLMLLGPTRAVLRPVAGALATRSLVRRAVFADPASPSSHDVIDGEGIDVVDSDLPAVIRKPE